MSRSLRVMIPLGLAALLAACGGGGGGGGSSGGGGPAQANVSFLGFAFRIADGALFTTPPVEATTGQVTSLGAPLDMTVVFRFSGVPVGPFTQATLPVFTTFEDITPAAGVTATPGNIAAKGTYVVVGNNVEFRPFVPTAPLQIPITSPPESVPGLFPDSTYTARVNTGNQSIGNLGSITGPNEIEFGTTSNPAAYYPTGVGATNPPAVVSTDPGEGNDTFFPGLYSPVAPGALLPTFPPGAEAILVTYDRPVAPFAANLGGADLDGDGAQDPTFFLRVPATQLLVAREVAAGTFGAHDAFAALTALDDEPGTSAAVDGSDIVLHGSLDGALPSPDGAFDAAPLGLASARDPDLLFVLLPPDGGSARLAVAGHVQGDPRFAAMALDADGGTPVALETGLADPVGLLTLLDGRLVTFDRATRRVVELLVTVVPRRAEPGDSSLMAPLLLAVSAADGETGFLSEPWTSGAAADADVRGLAQSPSGALYALAVMGADPFPSLVPMETIDPEADGAFAAEDGLLTGSAGLSLAADYVAVVFVDESEFLALEPTSGVVDRIDLDTGDAVRIADGLFDGTSLTQGFLALDTDVEMVSNAPAGAVLSVEPHGVLPFGEPVQLMQRNTFASLYGANLLNSDPEGRVSVLGAQRVVEVFTAVPLAGAESTVDDAFIETFATAANESPSPLVTSPPADWAALGSGNSGVLRAAAGIGTSGNLGDFLPKPEPDFNPALAYLRAPFPWAPPTQAAHTTEDREEQDIDWSKGNYATVFLDTNVQNFPLSDGSTPGVTAPTTVSGGSFVFRDFVIPLGVRLVVKGSNPLRITATGKVEIHGVIDVSGVDGAHDDSFDSALLPTPGGAGGPGGGRGGDGHPTLFDPSGPGTIDQYVTPERAERGWGPMIDGLGSVSLGQVGGWGGVSTFGYTPNFNGVPYIPPVNFCSNNSMAAMCNGFIPNNEHHRPPGGGGGSMYQLGRAAPRGTGVYLVQSDSTWFPFSKCPTDDFVNDVLYGNDENFWAGVEPSSPLQCVYMVGTTDDPERFKPGGAAGDPVFADGDASNDFIGAGGEVPVLIGGQGGGGGGTRIDSLVHSHWAGPFNDFGLPDLITGPPYYPGLNIGIPVAPSVYDGKGGAGGGGGGGLEINGLGDIWVSRTGHIDATGGHGGGGEVVQSSTVGGGGGGGSGGAVLLRSGGRIRIDGDPGNLAASFIDSDGDQGASIEVSGGFGRDAATITSDETFWMYPWTYEYTRSDGGQGGFGLIQLQEGGDDAVPTIQQGAFLFAKLRTVAKLGTWTGDLATLQGDHYWYPEVTPPGPPNQPQFRKNEYPIQIPPVWARYIDMLHYPLFDPENGPNQNRYFQLNGSFPPIIPRTEPSFVQGGLLNEYPPGSNKKWLDTLMTTSLTGGLPAVREPLPARVMKTYLGWNPTTFIELGSPPGETYAGQDIPMTIVPKEPDGTPHFIDSPGGSIVDPATIIDRLPVVPLERAPPPFGRISHGVSRWLDFQGVRVRMRGADGRPPPFFQAIHGTYNAAVGSVPAGKAGQVVTGSSVPGKPAKFVLNTVPLDPGLFGNGVADPPFNDIKVDAPEFLIDNAVTDNANVILLFQGAYAIRAGSSVPDPETVSEWVADVTQLDGYPLVRFVVTFDLGADVTKYPFSTGSFRPAADSVRLRTEY